MKNVVGIACLSVMFMFMPSQVLADDLYQPNNWSDLASDRKASQVGDVLSVVVYQSAEASNLAQNSRDRRSSFDANVDIDVIGVQEYGDVSFGGGFVGRGETRRREQFITRISATIDEVLPNGNYLISGGQYLLINGERTRVNVRGVIRPEDITGDNQILSTRIANAEIEYDGSGFVTKGTKPGIFHRLFSFLGLG